MAPVIPYGHSSPKTYGLFRTEAQEKSDQAMKAGRNLSYEGKKALQEEAQKELDILNARERGAREAEAHSAAGKQRAKTEGMDNAMRWARRTNPGANPKDMFVAETANGGGEFLRTRKDGLVVPARPVFRSRFDGDMKPVGTARGAKALTKLQQWAHGKRSYGNGPTSAQIAARERWNAQREFAQMSGGAKEAGARMRAYGQSGELFGRQVSAMRAQGGLTGLRYDPYAAHNGQAFVERYNRNLKLANLAQERERINNLSQLSRTIYGHEGPTTDEERAALAKTYAQGTGGMPPPQGGATTPQPDGIAQDPHLAGMWMTR